MKRRELAALLALGLLWGSSFLLIKIAVGRIPPFTLVAGRVACAAAVLLLLARLRGLRLPPFGPVWGVFLAMGVLNGALPYTLISVGEVTIDSGLASILNASMPIFTVLLAHFLTADERFRWEKLLGVALGLGGVVLLVGPEVLRGLGRHFWAQLAVVGAAVSYALAAIVGRRHLKGYPPLVSAAGQLSGATLIMLPLSLLLDAPWRLSPSWGSVAALLCLSLLGTALAYLLYFHLLKEAGATSTSLVTFLLPVTAILWGALLLGETVHWRMLAALLLILSGITLTGGWLRSAGRRGSAGPSRGSAAAGSRTGAPSA